MVAGRHSHSSDVVAVRVVVVAVSFDVLAVNGRPVDAERHQHRRKRIAKLVLAGFALLLCKRAPRARPGSAPSRRWRRPASGWRRRLVRLHDVRGRQRIGRRGRRAGEWPSRPDRLPAAAVVPVAPSELVFPIDREVIRPIERPTHRVRRFVALRVHVVLHFLRREDDELPGFFRIRLAEHRRTRDDARRVDVFLHQHRRQRQHVADVVEAVPRVVYRELVGGPQRHAEQIANRVVVFGAVEAPRRHASRIGCRAVRTRGNDAGQVANPSRDCRGVGRGQRRHRARRHLARDDLVEHLLPHVDSRTSGSAVEKRLEAQACPPAACRCGIARNCASEQAPPSDGIRPALPAASTDRTRWCPPLHRGRDGGAAPRISSVTFILEPHAQAKTDVAFRIFTSGALRRVDDAESVQIAHGSIRIELQVRDVQVASGSRTSAC